MANNAMHVTKNILNEQNVFIIQPYIKWGPKKSITSPDLKLQEAEALVRSLPNWTICDQIVVPLESLDKRALFGVGKLDEIKLALQKIRASGNVVIYNALLTSQLTNKTQFIHFYLKVTCVFISKGTLTFSQKHNLEECFGVPVMDRYSVVIQILRLHATSTEAKLQVAMAEIPYIWSQLKDGSAGGLSKITWSLSDAQKQLLRNREKKLKTELASVRNHR